MAVLTGIVLGSWLTNRFQTKVNRVLDAVGTALDSSDEHSASIPRQLIGSKTSVAHSASGLPDPPASLLPQSGTTGRPAQPSPSPTVPAWNDLVTIEDMDFVRVSAGAHVLGPHSDELMQLTSNDEPQRLASIPDEFWIMKTELTQQTYERIMHRNPSKSRSPDLPVTNVTITDVEEVIDAFNNQFDDVVFRLPTEEEFEYASRLASAECPFPIPDDASLDYRNAFEKHQAGDPDFLIRFVSLYACFDRISADSVAKRLPNGIGLFDMSGNVWEWCAPSLNRTYSNSDYWPLRGGGCSSTTVWGVTCSARAEEHGDEARESIGFRLVIQPRP